MVGALRAGVAKTNITPPIGVSMIGYGAREGPSIGIHDELESRALLLDNGQEKIAIVANDLCLVPHQLVDRVRTEAAKATGIENSSITICCSHTHSGPDTGIVAFALDLPLDPYLDVLAREMVSAIVQANNRLRNARLGIGLGKCNIGTNRRMTNGLVDDQVLVLRVDDASGAPMAVLFNYACHGTVLGHENLLISADYPGYSQGLVEDSLGNEVIALFTLGANGSTDPCTRGLLDIADEGQSLGAGFEDARRLGHILGYEVLRVVETVETRPEVAVRVKSVPVGIRSRLGDVTDEEARRSMDDLRTRIAQFLEVSTENLPNIVELNEVMKRKVTEKKLEPRAAKEAIALAYHYSMNASIPLFARMLGMASPAASPILDIEIQTILIGDCALLAIPGEPTVEVGLEWRRRAGLPHASVLSDTNGWFRYIPHPSNFQEEDADILYETLSNLFVPEAATIIIEAGLKQLAELTAESA